MTFFVTFFLVILVTVVTSQTTTETECPACTQAFCTLEMKICQPGTYYKVDPCGCECPKCEDCPPCGSSDMPSDCQNLC